jgi:prevent-host-death family protein
MSKIPDIVPISDFRQDAAAVLKRLQSAIGPLVVTQRGRAVAVMQSLEEYEKHERERELLKLLAAGEREISAGKGHNLSSVMNEADKLLEGGKG